MDASALRPLGALLTALVMLLIAAAPVSAAPDPLLPDQWAFGASDPIGARQAWSTSRGAGVVVAVIDSGVQIDHPDLAGAVWTNRAELANGIDDDANGFVDDLHGANMLDGSGDVTDRDGHGTHIAGIIAARSANGIGVSGIAPQAQLMPIKVVRPDTGLVSTSALARGIRYAVTQGARIISVSTNGDASSPEVADAVAFAEQQGATIVASAGNNGRDTDAQPSYPASLPSPALLSVTAATPGGALLNGTNYGAASVDLAAPGETIMSTLPGSTYGMESGTSMATPFVAGALALLAAAHPDLSQAQLREALLAGAARTPALTGRIGAGMLDVGAAMRRLGAGATTGVPAAARVRVQAARRAAVGGRATVRWNATNAGAITRWRVMLDGRPVRTLRSGQALRAQTRVTRAGRHRWTVTGFDAGNRKVVTSARSFLAVGAR
jgi:subtilisin family serine protease